MKGYLSPITQNDSKIGPMNNASQTRFARSKSQSMMPIEFANLQRSL